MAVVFLEYVALEAGCASQKVSNFGDGKTVTKQEQCIMLVNVG